MDIKTSTIKIYTIGQQLTLSPDIPSRSIEIVVVVDDITGQIYSVTYREV